MGIFLSVSPSVPTEISPPLPTFWVSRVITAFGGHTPYFALQSDNGIGFVHWNMSYTFKLYLSHPKTSSSK